LARGGEGANHVGIIIIGHPYIANKVCTGERFELMSLLPDVPISPTRCPRGYQNKPGTPAILPTACCLHCPIVRGKKVREAWLNAQDCAERLGYHSSRTFDGAWRRARIFRNILRREGTRHRATGFPLCGLLAYKQWRIETAGIRGSVPPFAQARVKAKREAASRARQNALVRKQEAIERMLRIKAGMSHSSTRRIVQCLLRHREGLSYADIGRVVGVTKQWVWAIQHEVA
jgi:hypothetical protein